MTKEEALNVLISHDCDTNKISDGYHTFGELYEHRIVLYIELCRYLHYDDGFYKEVWRSKKHSDGSQWEGWFILGVGRNAGDQITYHLPIDRWDDVDFAYELDKAPPYDGHTSADVLKRLKDI